MTRFAEHEITYVVWQNRAIRFYLAARRLHQSGLYSPAAYCSTIALELLLKATLLYWDKRFDPEAASHGMAKLARMVGNKVPGAKGFKVPDYFYFEQRFLNVSRYPKNGKGVLVPQSLLLDLDSLIVSLVTLVPFQHNTELRRILRGKPRAELNILRRRNFGMRQLRRELGMRAK